MSTPRQDRDRYIALSGGVGGAKLSLGLAQLLGERLTIFVNTGEGKERRLRGAYARVVKDGHVTVGDRVRKVAP